MTTAQLILSLASFAFTATAMGYFAIEEIRLRNFWWSVFYVTAFFTMTSLSIEYVLRLIIN